MLTWSAGKCSLVTALGLPCAYAAGGRVPALSFVLLLLTVLCRTGRQFSSNSFMVSSSFFGKRNSG